MSRVFSNYGEQVAGYEQGVVNDREVRAAAGLMFMFGMIVIFVGIGYNHIMVARVYLSLVFFDLTIRLINPSYSPFMLLGRLFVQNQKPEYVGAVQKRFAWFLGWIIFLPMMNWFVLNWDISFYKILLCVLCLGIIFLESAFGICIGCILYRFVTKNRSQYCPGGACEIRIKEPVQRFNMVQKILVGSMILFISIGTYLFLAKTESKTFFGEFLHELVLTDEQLEAQREAEFEAEFDEDDDDF
jgi:hypothetical protein